MISAIFAAISSNVVANVSPALAILAYSCAAMLSHVAAAILHSS
jgi:hypothetical protein